MSGKEMLELLDKAMDIVCFKCTAGTFPYGCGKCPLFIRFTELQDSLEGGEDE